MSKRIKIESRLQALEEVRAKKLEAMRAAQAAKDEAAYQEAYSRSALSVLIGYHLGGARSEKDLSRALIAGLGHPDLEAIATELGEAITSQDMSTIHIRCSDVYSRLLARLGLPPTTLQGGFYKPVKLMAEQLPEKWRQYIEAGVQQNIEDRKEIDEAWELVEAAAAKFA